MDHLNLEKTDSIENQLKVVKMKQREEYYLTQEQGLFLMKFLRTNNQLKNYTSPTFKKLKNVNYIYFLDNMWFGDFVDMKLISRHNKGI